MTKTGMGPLKQLWISFVFFFRYSAMIYMYIYIYKDKSSGWMLQSLYLQTTSAQMLSPT